MGGFGACEKKGGRVLDSDTLQKAAWSYGDEGLRLGFRHFRNRNPPASSLMPFTYFPWPVPWPEVRTWVVRILGRGRPDVRTREAGRWAAGGLMSGRGGAELGQAKWSGGMQVTEKAGAAFSKIAAGAVRGPGFRTAPHGARRPEVLERSEDRGAGIEEISRSPSILASRCSILFSESAVSKAYWFWRLAAKRLASMIPAGSMAAPMRYAA